MYKKSALETIEKEAERLPPEEHLKLVERLAHRLKKKNWDC